MFKNVVYNIVLAKDRKNLNVSERGQYIYKMIFLFTTVAKKAALGALCNNMC